MTLTLRISPTGHLFVEEHEGQQSEPLDTARARRIAKAFRTSAAAGLVHLATAELESRLPPDLAFAREFAGQYLTELCHSPDLQSNATAGLVPPDNDKLAAIALAAPPLRGGEYLNADALAGLWIELDQWVRNEGASHPGGLAEYLREKNPLWRQVGRVTFHLAENKRDHEFPFAFLATYTGRLSSAGRPQHKPLGEALKEYLGDENRPALLSLLSPVDRAAKCSALASELVESGDLFRPQPWTPAQAYRFLQDIPRFEESGLLVRVPDWWRAGRPPRPIVNVSVGGRQAGMLSADALLDFSVDVVLEGESLSDKELEQLLRSSDDLVWLKGRWVEVDRAKLREALAHWKKIERETGDGGLTFFEGMRLLSGISLEAVATAPPAGTVDWTGITAGPALEATLRELHEAQVGSSRQPAGLQATLRPYQRVGLAWLRFVTRLGLGACLADDMGLGKTIQVIALLLEMKHRRRPGASMRPSSLLVVPASLVANWKSELARFAPSLRTLVVHPSEARVADSGATTRGKNAAGPTGSDLVITTYGMLTRTDWLLREDWQLVIVDEAQNIKNAGTRQAQAARKLKSMARVALTGTPVENRLGDLWSLFDFLNPGLLGSAKEFAAVTKKLAARPHDRFGPLRKLIQPYLLRRLKTDKQVISDLPDKIEMKAYCQLTKRQAATYERAVADLAKALDRSEGIQRRGIVLATLMRLKQICDHPALALGEGEYPAAQSGKFARLAEICSELAERQQKALVFTQFREMTAPWPSF